MLKINLVWTHRFYRYQITRDWCFVNKSSMELIIIMLKNIKIILLKINIWKIIKRSPHRLDIFSMVSSSLAINSPLFTPPSPAETLAEEFWWTLGREAPHQKLIWKKCHLYLSQGWLQHICQSMMDTVERVLSDWFFGLWNILILNIKNYFSREQNPSEVYSHKNVSCLRHTIINELLEATILKAVKYLYWQPLLYLLQFNS